MRFGINVSMAMVLPMAACLAVTASQRRADALPLDSTFGSGGIVQTAVGDGHDYLHDVAVQSDGKIVVVGRTPTAPFGYDATLARYDSDGLLDPSFGVDGVVTTVIGTGNSQLSGVVVQPDGKIVAAGSAAAGTYGDIAVARYEIDGSLDNTFGTGGIVTTAIGSLSDTASALILQPDGKLVVAATWWESIGVEQIALVRYLADGSLDTTFGVDGVVATAMGGEASATALVQQPDGKLVVAGSQDGLLFEGFFVARYTASGALDVPFGSGGFARVSIGMHEFPTSVAVQSDGGIVAAGATSGTMAALDTNFAIARFTADGTLDDTFGSGGTINQAVAAGAADRARDVYVQANGQLIVVGDTAVIGDSDIVVARYDSDGTLDSSFGVGGLEITSFPGWVQAYSSAVQPDGKLVVGGYGVGPGGGFDFALARYVACGNGLVDTSEDCDAGSDIEGDCCAATCEFDSPGESCDDGDVCTGAETCDATGTCIGGNCNLGLACGLACFGQGICQLGGASGTDCVCAASP